MVWYRKAISAVGVHGKGIDQNEARSTPSLNVLNTKIYTVGDPAWERAKSEVLLELELASLSGISVLLDNQWPHGVSHKCPLRCFKL